MFRLFVDEVGHHNMKSSSDPNERYLGLTGVIIQRSYEQEEFTDKLEALKTAVLGRCDFCLHRRDIIDKKLDPFTVLKDEDKKKEFDLALLEIIGEAKYRLFTVVIDKREHKARYAVWQFQPFTNCMTVMLERYVQWLHRLDTIGDVMAESRGKKENKQLAKSYRRIYARGTDHVPANLFQARLTSNEIKLKQKSANIPGLQLADLIANPSCRELICNATNQQMTAEFGKKVVEVLYRKKYLRSVYDGHVSGWGTKWLP